MSSLLLHAPAMAGIWVTECSWSGQIEATLQGSNSTTLWGSTVGSRTYRQPGTSIVVRSSGTVTATLRWIPSGPADLAPATILVKQIAGLPGGTQVEWKGTRISGSGTPSFSGRANNGLGSPERIIVGPEPSRRGVAAGIKFVVKEVPGGTSSPTVTLDPVTITTNCTVTCPAGTVAEAFVTCDYTATVAPPHPHPTNMRETYRAVNEPSAGQLRFRYDWTSTDGDLSHLGHCRVGEWVTYDGNNTLHSIYLYNQGNYTEIPQGPIPYGFYSPGEDPYVINGVASSHRNPERGAGGWPAGTAVVGQLTDTHSPLPTSSMYPDHDVKYNATQVYGYRCDICMASDPPEYFAVLLNVGTISRSFRPISNSTWWYEIKKSGLTGLKTFP